MRVSLLMEYYVTKFQVTFDRFSAFELNLLNVSFVNASTQAEELGNRARELKGLIDDSESVIFINLDR